MNKEIIIYELLGLVKDGKAPKRIKIEYGYLTENYKYNSEIEWYETYDETTILTLSEKDDLSAKVQIIEEQDEFVDIDLIKLNSDGWITYKENGEYHNFNTNKKDKFYINKINYLIKNQKLIISKLKNE